MIVSGGIAGYGYIENGFLNLYFRRFEINSIAALLTERLVGGNSAFTAITGICASFMSLSITLEFLLTMLETIEIAKALCEKFCDLHKIASS